MMASALGVYGKVSNQADFLRSNAGEFSQAGLDRLLEEGMQALRTEGTALQPEPVAFLWSPPGCASAFVGALAPSSDAIGRSFPLAVFAQVPSKGLPAALPVLPILFGDFVRAAAHLLVVNVRDNLPGPELAARIQELAAQLPTEPHDISADAFTAESAVALHATFGDQPAKVAYALRTFCMACDLASKGGPNIASRVVVTVDAPAPTAGTLGLWLELARRRLQWRDALPSFLWTEGNTGRLLLTLGPPVAAALSFLANPHHRSQKFWPLRTEVAAAISQAAAALTPEQKRCVGAPGTSVRDVIAAFG